MRTRCSSRRAAGAIAILLAVGAMPASAREPESETYILAGQSNMSGRGALADLTDAERTPDARIKLYGNDGSWREAVEPLDSAEGQVDAVSADKSAAVGPGLFFARALIGKEKRRVALVPCAKGGSSIGRWKSAEARNTLYGSCIARAREAGGKIAGILWYQGESDADRNAETAASWSARFEDLVRGFRRELGSNKIPVVFVQLADRPMRDPARNLFWSDVQEAQAKIDLGCTAMVSAAGLERLPDQLHLTSAAQRELGPRLAATMAKLRKSGCR